MNDAQFGTAGVGVGVGAAAVIAEPAPASTAAFCGKKPGGAAAVDVGCADVVAAGAPPDVLGASPLVAGCATVAPPP